MPNYYAQSAGRIYTAPYCASHVILLRYRTPFHSYGLVTGTFPEHPWNPIYMHLCHIFLYLYISEIFLTLLSSSLMDGWLVENWRCNMYYLDLTRLITKKCAILQPNYCVSICMPISCPEIGGAICIIIAGPFDCQYFI